MNWDLCGLVFSDIIKLSIKQLSYFSDEVLGKIAQKVHQMKFQSTGIVMN